MYIFLLIGVNHALRKKPQIFAKKDSALLERVKNNIPALQKVYTLPWWYPFGDMQTIINGAIRKCPKLPFVREVIEFADGGALGIDWLYSDNCKEDAPIVLFLPGITAIYSAGSTSDCAYVLYPALAVYKRDWRVVVYNPRGLAGVHLRNKIAYNAIRHHDVADVLKRISVRYPKAKIFGCGFSMGGIVLWNYLATRESTSALLSGAFIVSAPFDPHATTMALERFIPKYTYNRSLTKKLVAYAERYKEHFQNLDVINFDHAMKSVTIREFDSRFTAPLFGYESVDQYYADVALKPKVKKIPIPTLCLNADDDNFSPREAIPTDEISESESVVGVVTRGGGHSAFMQNANPNQGSLVDQVLLEWIDLLMSDVQ